MEGLLMRELVGLDFKICIFEKGVNGMVNGEDENDFYMFEG